MKRIFIGFIIFVIIILSGVAFYLNYMRWKPCRCNTHVAAQVITIDGEKLEFNVNINMVTTQKGKSEWLVVGSLKGPQTKYAISRRVFLSTRESGFEGFTKSMITREERQPIDNLPDTIWQQYLLPEAPGVAFYMEMKRLNKNMLFVRGLGNPFFVCNIIEN